MASKKSKKKVNSKKPAAAARPKCTKANAAGNPCQNFASTEHPGMCGSHWYATQPRPLRPSKDEIAGIKARAEEAKNGDASQVDLGKLGDDRANWILSGIARIVEGEAKGFINQGAALAQIRATLASA